MQRAISDKIRLGEILNLLKDYSGVPSVNDEGTLENLIGKVDKVTGLVKTGKADGDLSRYYPNILPITRQSQIPREVPRKAYASITYSDKKQLEFVIDLTADTYSNYSTIEICIPIKFMKKSNKAQQMDANMITVNNIFGHWFTDIDISYRIAQLRNYIFEKNVYRILLTLLCDLGKVNFAMKTGTRIIMTLERNLNKLFESNKKVATAPDNPDALIQIYDRSYVSYQEISLTQGADIYFTGVLRSETALRQGVLPSPYQQVFEVNTGTQDFNCTFKGAQRQFDWLEISIVYDKSYQPTTIYDGYDLELAAKLIKSTKFENNSSTYSLTGKL